jgi:hypothetical protein
VFERIIGRRCLPLRERRQPATLLKVTAARSPLPARRKLMSYRIAGIDVHKKVLAVVVSDVEVDGEY